MLCLRRVLHARPAFGARRILLPVVFLAIGASLSAATPTYSLDDAHKFLTTYCAACHQGKSAAGGLNLPALMAASNLSTNADRWNKIVARVRNAEMPPRGAPAPAIEAREQFADWTQNHLKAEVCEAGPSPGRAPLRRLNRSEYTATIRDLLDIHLDVGHALPADGAGGEGFDNAAETLFLSPVHAEKYMEAARLAIETLARDAKARAKILIAKPDDNTSPEQAARKILDPFLARAYRHPVEQGEVDPYIALFKAAQKSGDTFDDSVLFALRGALMSPQFLFRVERPNPDSEPRLLDDYALASRLAYFLWGSMPDSLLFDLAAARKLQDPEILKWQVARMLRSPKAVEFMTRFVEQWLGTRELGRSINPDPKLFPMFSDDELRSDIRYQPVMFFREILANDLSLLNLIDSNFTVATRKLQRLYGLNIKPPRPDAGGQPQRIELPEASHRGGLLGMSAVLITSSYPHRTSPVLRGKWILDAMLGTPPAPPPPGVSTLAEHQGGTPQTMRERLLQHRADAMCASCHSRIDPLGFALENYDALGRWRTEDAERPIDSSGQLPDGTTIAGPEQLKMALLERKSLFLRNLTSKMLGYALGRGLTLQDSCVVDNIMLDIERNDYKAQSLVNDVVFSAPFRYQEAAVDHR
jgi:mono/diheme cytochrome c family protein